MSQILLYQSEDGRTKLDVRLENQTLWLNQKQLTELFGKAKGTISEHIKHIFEDGELEEISVVRLFRTTATDGKIYEVSHYNLDMVLALGFRVRSPMAVRFRQWAADKLKEYITKGFVLDDDRLKNPQEGNDYFEELTRRIQDIRTSERRFYQKITDIYATSIDYDKDAPLTQSFYATVQNKVHFAIHGQTAAEVITSRADRTRALANRPEVLLLDEPFGALDAKVRKDLRRWLREFHDLTRLTTIFVTHDQDEAFEVADRVVLIDKGSIQQSGTPSEVRNNPANSFVSEFLGLTEKHDPLVKSECQLQTR